MRRKHLLTWFLMWTTSRLPTASPWPMPVSSLHISPFLGGVFSLGTMGQRWTFTRVVNVICQSLHCAVYTLLTSFLDCCAVDANCHYSCVNDAINTDQFTVHILLFSYWNQPLPLLCITIMCVCAPVLLSHAPLRLDQVHSNSLIHINYIRLNQLQSNKLSQNWAS